MTVNTILRLLISKSPWWALHTHRTDSVLVKLLTLPTHQTVRVEAASAFCATGVARHTHLRHVVSVIVLAAFLALVQSGIQSMSYSKARRALLL